MGVVYALKDPRDGRVRYVGATSRPRARFAAHLSAGRVALRNDGMVRVPRDRWIGELAALGLTPVMTQLCAGAGDGRFSGGRRNLRDAERRWVRKLRAAGESLLSMTPGPNGLRRKAALTHQLLADPEAILELIADAKRVLRGHADGPDFVAAPDAFGLDGASRRDGGESNGGGRDDDGDGSTGVGAHRSMLHTAAELGNADRIRSGAES